MKRFPLFLLAAALVAAVPAPAQFSIQARFDGRHVQGSLRVGDCAPRRVVRHDDCHVHRPPVRQHGHWQTIEERVLIPGYWHDEHVPPTYGWIRDHCGHRHWGVVDPGGCRRVWVPARWETRCRRVWVAC
jgi:hypothetical protein